MKTTLLVFLFCCLAFAGCYTQLRPPFNPAGTTAEKSKTDTVYAAPQEYQYFYDPYSPYYYSRYERWRHYYSDPWWRTSHRYDYWNNYWYDYGKYQYPSQPAPSSGTKPPRKSNTSSRRKLDLGPKPAPKKVPAEKEPDLSGKPVPAAADPEEDTEEEKPVKKKSNTNQRKKLKLQ